MSWIYIRRKDLIQNNIHIARISTYSYGQCEYFYHMYPRLPLEFYAVVPDIVNQIQHTEEDDKWIIDIDTSENVLCFSS